MSSLEDLRKKLLLQKESMEPVEKKTRANKGKSHVLTDEQRQTRSEAMKSPERLEKMKAGREAAAAKKRAEKEELERAIKEEAMERLKGRVEKEAINELQGKPAKKQPKAEVMQQKLYQLVDKLDNAPKYNTEMIDILNEQIAELNKKMERLASVPVKEEPVKEEPIKTPEPVQEPVEPEPKNYYYKPKTKQSLRKTYYDPYGLNM